MIAAFEEANPGIKIDYTRTEQDDYFEKLQVAMPSGTGPDLFGLITGPMKEQYAPFAEEMSALADANWNGWWTLSAQRLWNSVQRKTEV